MFFNVMVHYVTTVIFNRIFKQSIVCQVVVLLSHSVKNII